MNDYTPSDAAKAYAIPAYDSFCRDHGSAERSIKEAFDAGIAHERESRKPRTITTASELDALPRGAVVLDGDRDAWQKNHADEWVMVGCENSYSPGHVFSDSERREPPTLLVPASDAPEPVRLTDADDERIKPGALVAYDSTPEPDGTWTTYRHRLIGGNSGSVNTAAYVREQIRLGNSCYSLLSEAAPDPDAEIVAVLPDLLENDDGEDWTESRVRYLLGEIRTAGYDVVKRVDQ